MFCPKCGTNVDDSFNFCFKCGFDFSVIKQTMQVNDISVAVATSDDILKEKATNASNVAVDEYCSSVPVDVEYGFETFDGTQERYESLYNNLCFEQENFELLYAFNRYISQNYSGEVFEAPYKVFTAPLVLAKGKQVSENGIVDALYEHLCTYNSTDVQVLADTAGAYVVFAHWYDFIGRRDYELKKYRCEFDRDRERYETLERQVEITDDVNKIEILKQKMRVLKNKYDDWSYEKFVLKVFNILDLVNLASDISKYAKKYASFISNIYEKVLDKAIEYHELNCLENKYPTKEQLFEMRRIVVSEFENRYRVGVESLPNVLQKIVECKNVAIATTNTRKEFSKGALIRKGTVAITQLWAMREYGVPSVMREGVATYEHYRNSKKLDSELDKEVSAFVDAYSELLDDLWEAHNILFDTMQSNISDKFLKPAIKDVFNVLRANGESLYSLEEYLEE